VLHLEIGSLNPIFDFQILKMTCVEFFPFLMTYVPSAYLFLAFVGRTQRQILRPQYARFHGQYEN
jgi:hypothetical protein